MPQHSVPVRSVLLAGEQILRAQSARWRNAG